jgi:hypothetical protein
MWSDLLRSRLIIPLALLAIFSSLAITPLVFYFAQREVETRRIATSEDVFSKFEIDRERVFELDYRITKLEATNRSMQQQIDTLTSQLSQVIALTSGKEKKQ